jgi:hypothetical protein
MNNCPAGKKECPCKEFSKEGLCDYPYRLGMSLKEIKLVKLGVTLPEVKK